MTVRLALGTLFGEAARIARFAAVGIAATLTHVAALAALVEGTGMDPVLANPLAVALAIPVSYAGHYFFTYRSTKAHGQTVLRFLAVALSSFLVSQAVVMAVEALGGPYQLAAAIFVVAVPATNFVLFNLLVFRERPGGLSQGSSETGPSVG